MNWRILLEKGIPNCVLFGRTQGKILVVVHDLTYTCRVSHLNTDLMEEVNVEGKHKVWKCNTFLDVTIHFFQKRFCKLQTRVSASEISFVFSHWAPQWTAKWSSNIKKRWEVRPPTMHALYLVICMGCMSNFTVVNRLWGSRRPCNVSLVVKEEDS